jgi:hypothetical protein
MSNTKMLVREVLQRGRPSITLIRNPGKYSERDMPDYSNRNFPERGFTVGIGGQVYFRVVTLRAY